MAEGGGSGGGGAAKKKSGGGLKLGCGCLFLFIMMLGSFILGGRYGKETVDKTFEKIGQIVEVVKKSYAEVSGTASTNYNQATSDAARSYDQIKENADVRFKRIDAEIDKNINKK